MAVLIGLGVVACCCEGCVAGVPLFAEGGVDVCGWETFVLVEGAC